MRMQIHDDKMYFNTVSPEPVEARPPFINDSKSLGTCLDTLSTNGLTECHPI